MSVLPLTHVTQRTGYLYGVEDNIKSVSGLDYTSLCAAKNDLHISYLDIFNNGLLLACHIDKYIAHWWWMEGTGSVSHRKMVIPKNGGIIFHWNWSRQSDVCAFEPYLCLHGQLYRRFWNTAIRIYIEKWRTHNSPRSTMLNRIFSAVLFLHSYTFGLFAYYYYYYYKERQRFVYCSKTPRGT